MEFSAKQIATFIQGEIVGDENATVHTFAKIEEGIPGAISFLSNPKYTSYIYETQALSLIHIFCFNSSSSIICFILAIRLFCKFILNSFQF